MAGMMMTRLSLSLSLIALGVGAASAEPGRYASPEAAVSAVIAALEARDREAVVAVFGPEAEDVVSTGDQARDREIWTDFLNGWREAHRIGIEGEVATLYIGREQWPFPIRLRRDGAAWAFDAEGAREEIRLRRIGRNELDVIELVQAYVRVQGEYRRTDWDGDGVMEFAEAILSDRDQRNGLYWPTTPGWPDSPVGDFMARASADGYSLGDETASPEPYLGYYYRVLTAQGAAAPGGAMGYIINGNMVAGHAMLAYPAEYGISGIMSFLVGEAGVIFEADLGPDTVEAGATTDSFNPDERWMPVE